MTLSTDIYIDGPIAHRAVYDKVNEILGIVNPAAKEGPVDTSYSWNAHKEGYWDIDNVPGQGFKAWVMTCSRLDGERMIRPAEDDPDDPRPEFDEGYVSVNLDTAYGYREGGLNCTTLHASVIVDLGQWLLSQGVTFRWRNEYTGEVNAGFNGIEDFIGSGDEASAWFESTVKPALLSEYPQIEFT